MRKLIGVGIGRPTAAAVTALLGLLACHPVQAGISYTTMGLLYSENFDSLPTDIPSGNIQNAAAYSDGWRDDVIAGSTPQNDVSVPGWHLWHPLAPGGADGENGFNHHQRLRVGPGANTGSFWLFGDATTSEDKALGSQGATTVSPNGEKMFMGLQLINDTGAELNRFTLTFDGEQWRDGQSASAETLEFDFSTFASDGSWTEGGFTAVPQLNFTSPVFSGVVNNGTAVNGNAAGRVADISFEVTNFTWLPGDELWLRWGDTQLEGFADDNLGIDNVRFTADAGGTGATNDVFSVQTGLASNGATWSNGQATLPGNTYRVRNGDVVTLDSAFNGTLLRAQPGGTVNISDGGNATAIPLLIIDAGANLTHSVTGNFQLGVGTNDPAQDLGTMTVNQDLEFDMNPGADVRIDLAVSGEADLVFNSSGAGSDLLLFDASGLDGVIEFNGDGDKVRLVRNQSFGTIEMNSTGGEGANILSFENTMAGGSGIIIFNEPGTIDHASKSTTSPTNNRTVDPDVLQANAPVTIDLSKTFVAVEGSIFQERRLIFDDNIVGTENITVNGTATDSTNLAAGITLNEFEFGSTADFNGPVIPTSNYSGEIIANDYVNVELRLSMPAASIVVNDHARFESGRQVVGTGKVINFGDIRVNAGGTFEVGFEQVQDIDPNSAQTGNHVGHVGLVVAGERTGSLTLTDGGLSNPADVNSDPLGSMLVMQLNGKDANQFDTIAAAGSVELDGVLKVLFNPKSSLSGAGTPSHNSVYTPALNDEIVLITSSAGSLSTDFDGSGTVDGGDLAEWEGNFGAGNTGGDADGDDDTDGADFLSWQRDLGMSSLGGITGEFDDIVFVDVAYPGPSAPPVDSDIPDTTPGILVDSEGVMADLGLKFEIQYSSSAVKLVVVSNAASTAIPEPSTALLAVAAGIGLMTAQRRRRV